MKQKGAMRPGGNRLYVELAWSIGDRPGELLTVEQIAGRMELLPGVRKPVDRAVLRELLLWLSGDGSRGYNAAVSRSEGRFCWALT